MRNLLRSNWASFLVVALSLIFGVLLMPHLPEQIATHWGMNGQPDRHSSREFAVFFFPLFTIGVVLFMHGLVSVSPKNYDMPNSRSVVAKMNLAVALMMTIIQGGILLCGWQPEKYSMDAFVSIAPGVFLLLTGNFMSKVERNFFIGVRVPWALATEQNWRATHRFAARAMVIGGLLILGLSPFAGMMIAAIAILVVATTAPAVYSYVYFARHERA